MTEAKSVISSSKGTFQIGDFKTDIVCSKFTDKLFIIITQVEKIGNLVLVTRDKAIEEEDCKTFSTKVLLGKDSELLHVVAKTLGLRLPVKLPILFGLSLRDESPATVRALHAPLKHVVHC